MDPFMLTVGATAKILGFDRSVVAGMCRRGELPFVPCLRPDGSKSRVHKRIAVSAIQEWIRKNMIHTPEDFKAAVDRRRRR